MCSSSTCCTVTTRFFTNIPVPSQLCCPVQELIFSLPGFTGYGWYLTLIQFGYYSVFGKIEMSIRGEARWCKTLQENEPLTALSRRVPLRTYTLLAVTTVATMGFSNASLGYLNYPTQVSLPVKVVRW